MIRKSRHWLGREEGSATIEFCIWFPFLIIMLGSAFEASLITSRQVLLTNSLDRTVRDLQLGNLGSPTHSELKTILCNRAGFIPNCLDAMHIEMERVSTSNWSIPQGAVQCVDLDEETQPAMNFAIGDDNDLMLITVCAAVEPLFPSSGLALSLPKINGGTYYGLVAFSAYVVEPA